MYYGIDYPKEYTISEIACALGISASRVFALLHNAEHRIRHNPNLEGYILNY